MKTSDDRVALDASAGQLAITEEGEAWVGFGTRGFVAKFNRACDEVGRALVPGRIVAMDALRDGSMAVLCSGRHDPWGRRTADSTLVVLSPDGEELRRRVLPAQPSTALVAESGARFHVDGQWSVVTLTSAGAIRSRPMGGAPRALCRDPRTREPWLSLPYRVVALDEALADGARSLTTVIPGYTKLAAKRVDGGAWAIYRTYNRAQPYALVRLAPTTDSGPYRIATIVAEVLLASQPTHLAAVSDGGAWLLLPGAKARRVDVIGNTVETVEWSERSSENRAFASSDAGQHCAALIATADGCVLRRATLA